MRGPAASDCANLERKKRRNINGQTFCEKATSARPTFARFLRESVESEERERVEEVEGAEHALAERRRPLLCRQRLLEHKHQQCDVEESEGEGEEGRVLECQERVLHGHALAPQREHGSYQRAQEKPHREGDAYHCLKKGKK